MIYLITGASHTGKTFYAQKLLEKLNYPYLSIDHLKMGLIRSGNTDLTPLSADDDLTEYLWPIVREMIKTAIENNQNLIVEGCYVPLDWAGDFNENYLQNIVFRCIVMTEKYIRANFDKIKSNANVIENRLSDEMSEDEFIADNLKFSEFINKYESDVIIIDDNYELGI